MARKLLRILILSQYYAPDIAGGSFRITETVELLRSKGHTVRVVTARPHRVRVENADSRSAYNEGVVRSPLLSYGDGGKWRYITHYLSFMVGVLVLGLLRGGRADVVLATSPPLFVGLSGWLVARLKGARFVLDIRDIWPDSAVATGHLSQTGALFGWAKVLEGWLYRRADIITCVAQPMADYIQSFVPKKRITVIYNGAQEKYFDPPATGVAPRRVSLDPAKINVVYVGNMGYCQALSVVVEAARLLRDEGHERLRFYLVGNGSEREKVLALKQSYGLDNIVIPGSVPREEALLLVHEASALFLPLKEDLTMGKTIPSKVFDYMVGGQSFSE